MRAKSNSPSPAQRQSSGRAKTQFVPISDRQKSVSRPVPQIALYLSMRTHSSAGVIRRCGDRLLWFVAMLLGGALPVEECVLIERYRAICGTGRLTDFWRSLIGTNCVLARPLDWRWACEGELLFAFSHCAPNVPDRVVGVNPACRFQVLAFCFVAG